MNYSTISLLIPLLLFSLFLHPVVSLLEQPFDMSKIWGLTPRYINRTHSISTSSPLAKALSKSPHPLTKLHRSLLIIISAIDKRVDEDHYLACNIRAEPWLDLSEKSAQSLQIVKPERTCQSSLDIVSAVLKDSQNGPPEIKDESILENSKHDFRNSAAHIVKAAKEVLPSIIAADNLSNFNSFHSLSNWNIEREGQKCTIENAMAYRVNGTLYLHVGVTNHPVDAFLPDLRRSFISEFVDQNFNPLRMIQPLWTNNSQLVNATTILRQWEGRADFASVEMTIDDNPALSRALQHNEVVIDLANDAITPSNIAILALPMIMTLVPVAFIAELSTMATLMYIVFTDLLSTLPFAIKGIELFHSGNIRKKEMVAYHIGNSTYGKLEVWTAECHGSEGFRRVGIAFLCIAISVTILGIALEVSAWYSMYKRGNTNVKGPFGERFHDDGLLADVQRGYDEVDEYDGEVPRSYSHIRRRRRPQAPDEESRYAVGAADGENVIGRHDFY